MNKPNHDYLGRRDASCGCCCVIDIAGLEHFIDDLDAARAQVERARALANEWDAKQSRNRAHYIDGPILLPTSPNLPPMETFEPVSELRAALATEDDS